MGPAWHPLVTRCDPTRLPMQLERLTRLEGVSEVRLADRRARLEQVDAHFAAARHGEPARAWDVPEALEAWEIPRSNLAP